MRGWRNLLVLAASLLVCVSLAIADSTTSYTYDELGRLKSETTPSGTTTYNYDPAGNRTSVTPGIEAPAASLTANPAAIIQGSSSTLSWTSSGGTSASLNNGIGAVTPLTSGSTTVNPSQTTVYTLTVTGAGGVTTQRLATVAVSPPTPPPSGAFTANPPELVRGDSSTLAWTSANATSASINNQASTPVASGTLIVSPTTTTNYVLTLAGPSGSTTLTRTVTVGLPPTGNLIANPSGIAPGASTTLSWASTNAVSASIDNGVGIVTPVSGGSVTVNPSATTTYTLTLGGVSATRATSTATVTVSAVNHAPIASADALEIDGDFKQYVTQCFDPRENDTDQDGDTLTITSITQPPVYATATYTGTQICVSAYTYNRSTNMTYTISDGRGGTATGTITINIVVNE